VGMEMKTNRIEKERRKEVYICIAIILILFLSGFFIRFFPVRTGFHYWDECVYLQHAEIISGTRSIENFNEFNIRPPLLPLLISLFYLPWHSVVMAHLVVSLISALGIIFIFFLGKELFNKKIAILSSLFYTFLPLTIQLSHDILVDTVLPTFWILVFLFTIKAIKGNGIKHSIFAGIFLALAILMKSSSLILPFFIFLIFFIYSFYNIPNLNLRKRISNSFFEVMKNKKFWIIFILAFIVMLPYFIWETLYFGNPLYSIILYYLVVNWDTPTSFMVLYTGFNKLFPLILLLGVAFLIFFNVKSKFIKKEELSLFVIVLIFFLSMHTMGHKESRFLLPITPFLSLLSAKGLMDFATVSSIFKIKGKILKALKIVMITAFFILFFASIFWIGQDALKLNRNLVVNEENGYMKAAFWIKDNTPNESIIYVNTQYPVTAYYSERKIIVLPFWEKFQGKLPDIMSEEGYFILFSEKI
jgi:4-amino-4-deoxy-L-arabinose transferase-like glycosyltransferase